MRILVIGGTVFVGRHIVDAALERGHEITLFNRNKANPGLFDGAKDVEMLIGDRDEDLRALEGKSWDAVVDTCGYKPSSVSKTVKILSDSADSYVFISSVSAYADLSVDGVDESGEVSSIPAGTLEEEAGYGPLKAACETVVNKEFSRRKLVIRPGLIVGPHDPTDRFTYWPVRIARGGKVVAPGDPERPVQFIDVRDLAVWIVKQIESCREGTFNATGPTVPVSMGELLKTCIEASNSDAELVWIDEESLADQEVKPWSDLPLWLPADHELSGIQTVDSSRAGDTGLITRPVARTVLETLMWFRQERGEEKLKEGLDSERERDLLEQVSARHDVAKL